MVAYLTACEGTPTPHLAPPPAPPPLHGPYCPLTAWPLWQVEELEALLRVHTSAVRVFRDASMRTFGRGAASEGSAACKNALVVASKGEGALTMATPPACDQADQQDHVQGYRGKGDVAHATLASTEASISNG